MSFVGLLVSAGAWYDECAEVGTTKAKKFTKPKS
jgi:hypothetical protein